MPCLFARVGSNQGQRPVSLARRAIVKPCRRYVVIVIALLVGVALGGVLGGAQVLA